MPTVLAEDLDSLHQKYSPTQLLDRIWLHHRSKGFTGVDDFALFLHTYRIYHQAKDGQETARGEYEEFLRTHRIPLFVARCLLPQCVC